MSGDVLALTADSARAGSFNAQDIYVDGNRIGEIRRSPARPCKPVRETVVLLLQQLTLSPDAPTGPDILSRGFIHMRESGDLIRPTSASSSC